MAYYRKKPIVVEARQYTRNGLEAEQVAQWCGGRQKNNGCLISTKEGNMLADYGDWIIKETFPTGDRNFYPCKPDIFEKTYEPA